MRKHFGKKIGAIVGAAIVVVALSASAAFGAPVLQPGQTSAPGMSGNCSKCHTYATPKPAAPPVLFSRPFLKGSSKIKRTRAFNVAGYSAPELCTAASATVTISVQRRNSHGAWVATPSYNQTATVSATGKYAGKVNYTAKFKIRRLGKYRLRARLTYVDASEVAQVKYSKPTTLVIKK